MSSRVSALTLVAAVAAVVACDGGKPAPAPPRAPVVARAPRVAPPPPEPVLAHATKVRSLEGITEYRLDNGLSVLLFPDPTQSTITVNVVYLVGSRHEGYGETGMAHLLEHMMFKGTPRHRNVGKLLESRGAQDNAETDLDRTFYYETLPASQDNLEYALDLEADRMANASISPEDLKAEFTVVRNELESSENDSSEILDERVGETAFLWHNYGKAIIGSRSDIEHVPTSAIRAFYGWYYQPDNATLVVAGKLDEATTIAAIEHTFGALPRPARSLSGTYTIEPIQDGERRVTLARSGDVHLVEIAYHAVSGASPDYAAVAAAADILVREPAGRLYKKIVDGKLAATLTGGTQPLHDPALVTFTAEVRDGANVDKVEHAMTSEIEGLGAQAIDPKALERWRVATQKELDLEMADSSALALQLGQWIALGDWRTLFAYRDAVGKVTVADVQRVAKSYFVTSNRTVGRFVPTAAPVRAPATESANAAEYVKGVTDGPPIEEGEPFPATLDHIDERTARGELAGGVKFALLPKKTRRGKVTLQLRLHWGDDKSLQGKRTAGDLMGPLMMRGTTHKSYQDLQDLENQLKARISIASDAAGMTLSIETLRDQLVPAFDLAAEMMQSPAFPEAQLELIKQEWLAGYEQQLHDPQAIADQALAAIRAPWPKTDPRYPATAQEEIKALKAANVSDVVQFYRQLAGAGHGELVVVGDFDPAALTAHVVKLTGAWKSKKPYTRLPYKTFDVPGVVKSIDVKDKENSVLVLGHDIQIRDTDADYAPLLVANQVLGGDSGARLYTRLREAEGLSYDVRSTVYGGELDDAGGFHGTAIVAPQNLAKAEASFLDEVRRLTTAPVDPAEVERAKDAWTKDRETSLSDDGYVVNLLGSQLYNQRDMGYARWLRAGVRAVTAADVERVAKKYVRPDKLIVVDAGDHARAAAPAK